MSFAFLNNWIHSLVVMEGKVKYGVYGYTDDVISLTGLQAQKRGSMKDHN